MGSMEQHTPLAPTPAVSNMGTPAADGDIDPQRLDQEQQYLTAAGYSASVDPQRKTVTVTRDIGNGGTLAIMFYLDADYPITPPKQIMVNRLRSGWLAHRSAVAANWTPANWLSEIADEIASAGE
jgi:hypothetical protein